MIQTQLNPARLISVYNEYDKSVPSTAGTGLVLEVKDSPYRHDLFYVIDMKNHIK